MVIEDDHNFKGLIEKILPANKFRKIENILEDPANPRTKLGGSSMENPNLVLEEIVREILRVEVDTGNADHIHEFVIGKVEKALIGIVLEEEHGNQVRVARILGMNRNTLRKKMKELQISTRVVMH